MSKNLIAFLSAVIASLAISSATYGQSKASSDGRGQDRAEIRAHIESIFQAFIDWDVDKIYATHTEDWRGFLQGSRAPIKGIDEYMRANGIEWPRRDKDSKPTPNPSVRYEIKDLDIAFESPEVAVVSFIGEFQRTNAEATITLNRLRIMDVYTKRNGHWIQAASNTVADPAWRADRDSLPATVPDQMRQEILKTREQVWRAYFSNDRATLERLIPVDFVATSEGSEKWPDRDSILASSKRFAENGSKLVSIEFPKTEMQVYGNTIILYTTYRYEIESGGKQIVVNGRGTEIFVRRNGGLVNVGWNLDSDNN